MHAAHWSRATPDTSLALAAAGASLVILWLLPWPMAGLIMLWAALTAAGWFWPGPVLALVAFSVPVQAVGAIHAGPVSVTLTKLVLAALVAAFALRLAARTSRITLSLPVWAYAVIIATLLVSILHVQEVGSWAGEVYRWAIAAVVLVIAQDLVRDQRAAQWALAGIGVGVLAASAAGFYQVIAGVGPASFLSGGVIRAYATFGEPNPFAAYLELSVPLFVALAIASLPAATRERQGRLLFAGTATVALVGTAALLLTQSRGGLLGYAAALAVIVWWSGARLRLLSLLAAVFLVLVVALTPPGQHIAARFIQSGFAVEQDVQVTPATWANQERIAHWRAGIAMMEAYPWTGAGAGQFNVRYREFTKVWRFRIPRGHAHNGYIQMGAQAGVPGLIASFLFAGALLASTWRGFHRALGPANRAVALGGFAVMVAFCVHSVFDYLSVLSLGVQLSLAVALAMPIGRFREPPIDRDRLTSTATSLADSPRGPRVARTSSHLG